MSPTPLPQRPGLWRKLAVGFDAAMERLPHALEQAGFGVITHIDVQETFRLKLGAAFRRYRIVGACNPGLAHQVLQRDLSLGVLLPCNVVVYEDDDHSAVVGAVDPMATLGAAGEDPLLQALADDVARRLEMALDALDALTP